MRIYFFYNLKNDSSDHISNKLTTKKMDISKIKSIVDSQWFNNFILWTIVAAGILVGIQTYGDRVANWQGLIESLDMLILWIFTIEAILKIVAEGNRPQNYFKDSWNVFDFLIVVVCWAAYFLPGVNAGYVAVFRLARVLRVLRLVSALPKLKVLVDAMLKSIPSMGYVGILLLLLFYIYGAMGVFLFGENDPIRFGELGTSILTLFQITTMEGWSDIMYLNMWGCDHAVYGIDNCDSPVANPVGGMLYFVSFVMFGTMIVLNLFIGVIMTSMEEVNKEQELEDLMKIKTEKKHTILQDLQSMSHQMDEMKKQMEFLSFRLEKENGQSGIVNIKTEKITKD